MEDLRRLVIKLDGKIDRVDERLNSMDATLANQHAQLAMHIYRTELAEKRIEMLHEEVKPLSKFHTQVNTVFRIIGMLGTGLGVIVGIGKLLIELF